MTAELPPEPRAAAGEWWVRPTSEKGLLYAQVTTTDPIVRGPGFEPATALVEFSSGPNEQATWSQRYVDVERARRVLTARGFRRR